MAVVVYATYSQSGKLMMLKCASILHHGDNEPTPQMGSGPASQMQIWPAHWPGSRTQCEDGLGDQNNHSHGVAGRQKSS